LTGDGFDDLIVGTYVDGDGVADLTIEVVTTAAAQAYWFVI
jgi:hypothetical protein